MTALKNILNTINDIKLKGEKLSDQDILTILKATKSITKNKTYINSYIALFNKIDSKKLNNINALTKRELQILQAIGKGFNTANIAKNLSLKVSTIETHRKNIRKKLGLVGKGKLIEYAMLNNLSPK
ncbi:helix-turn-helix transcriptional regulator [Algibacter sp. PT7-4]|uniref:helix-turn-helix transcriptional regulator n=1 Tax=Algibacter ulvanivorans TaxID=3400999 RepID=UPI003AABDBA8